MVLSAMALPVAVGLLLGMLLAIEVGRRLGVARLARDPEGLTRGVGAAESAVFALLGLLIAFTFSGAASKFEGRRHLITEEANALGTAWLRVDLLPEDAQPAVRAKFRAYLDARLAAYAAMPDRSAAFAKLGESVALQADLWALALAAARRPDAPAAAAMLLLPALNAVFDIATTRTAATENHPPDAIYVMLILLSLVAALLIGYSGAQNTGRNWLHWLSFALILTLAIFLILDIEYPRRGLIRIDSADHLLIELRASMG
jgi:hypothetical protein